MANPEVRLLSIGEEAEKGNQLVLDAHALLEASGLNFAGNVESRELLRGAADVVVTRRLHRERRLKLLEGTIKTLLDALRDEISATTRGKLGGLLIRPAARRLREPARPGHLRRRLPARPARARRDRPRELVRARRSRTRSGSRARRRARDASTRLPSSSDLPMSAW